MPAPARKAVMDHIRIRDARDDELDIVASVMVDAFAEYAARMSPDAWSSFAHDIANVRGRMPDADLLVAEDDGLIVGAVTLYRNWRGAQASAFAVRMLSVAPERRGTGVGRALMEECIERARTAGRERIVLTATQEMEDARDLYDRMGFQRDASLDHEPAPGVRSEGYVFKL